jgi:hypothetical protein
MGVADSQLLIFQIQFVSGTLKCNKTFNVFDTAVANASSNRYTMVECKKGGFYHAEIKDGATRYWPVSAYEERKYAASNKDDAEPCPCIACKSD